MQNEAQLKLAGGKPEALTQALARGVLKRMPLTFLPFVNQQLREWAFLFPNERRSVESLLVYVAGLNEASSRELFRGVVELEEKMGVRRWEFSTTEQTIQNSSLLARSAFYQEWRRAVQEVFDACARGSGDAARPERRRLVLIDFPAKLPVVAQRVWGRWQGEGWVVKIEAPDESILERLLAGSGAGTGLLGTAEKNAEGSAADAWLLDVDGDLVAQCAAAQQCASAQQRAVLLSYARLNAYRENFSREMNTMRKDLADADAVYDTLRTVDVEPWCPAEVKKDAAVREFVRSLYLSGNGAVIFGNSFVEWGASEALRRARPVMLAARFGVRDKPKPFTGVAVFENPERANPLPPVEDVEGSAVDAEMLAHYIWLAAKRYQEYQQETVCVCIAEKLREAYVIGPAEFSLGAGSGPVSMDRLSGALTQWMA